MRVVAMVVALAASLIGVGTLVAADQTCPATSSGHHGRMMGPLAALKGLNLTDDQKAKVKELRKEYAPKFKTAAESVLTTDQKTAREAAVKTAKDAGKKGPEVFKAARAAVTLTADQKAKMKEVMKPLRTEFHDKLVAILTPEQQEQLKAKIAKHKAESK